MEDKTRFSLGQLVVTRGVNDLMEKDISFANDVQIAILRHSIGDWGEIEDEDWKSNEFALKNKERLISAYTIGDSKVKIWIITEWDRSVTTVLFPSEY